MFLLLFSCTASAEKRLLCIGCDTFLTQQDTRPASANNAGNVARLLQDHMDTVTVCSTVPTTQDAFADALQAVFGEADEADESWLYISTHGLLDEENHFSLLLSDGEKEFMPDAAALKALLDDIPGTKVLLIDACHSGALIGKGLNCFTENILSDPDCIVIASAGGVEDSWFWSARKDQRTGSGYFTDTLIQALSNESDHPADLNRDGAITLNELKQYMLRCNGASVIRTWPEESDFVLCTYDPETEKSITADTLYALDFENCTADPLAPLLNFSFTVRKPVRVSYQIVCYDEDHWAFDDAVLQQDSDYGIEAGEALSPGMKQKSLSLTVGEETDYGYALLHLFTQEKHIPRLIASHVLCVPPETGDPELEIQCSGTFSPELGQELGIIVRHRYPCALTVSVVDETGKNVRYLCISEPSRPQQLKPEGSWFCWNGCGKDGEPAAAGFYRIRVRTEIGEESYEAYSEWFMIK